jgi:hypothetical protein
VDAAARQSRKANGHSASPTDIPGSLGDSRFQCFTSKANEELLAAFVAGIKVGQLGIVDARLLVNSGSKSSGNLRTRDVVTLRKDHIRDGKLFLRTAKTGTNVFCPLPKVVLDALTRIDARGDYYFWSGESKPKSVVGDYQRALRRLFDLAATPRLFAHLFRHTFATELLTAGNSLETVAALLGNSPRIVEKHYHHWVRGRQEKLEEAVKNSWAQLGTVDAAEAQKQQKTRILCGFLGGGGGGSRTPVRKALRLEDYMLVAFDLFRQPCLESRRITTDRGSPASLLCDASYRARRQSSGRRATLGFV